MNHTQRLRRYAIALATVLAAYGGVSDESGENNDMLVNSIPVGTSSRSGPT